MVQRLEGLSLIEELREPDGSALEEAFDEFAPAIFKYLVRRGLGEVEADEVVGETFGRLLDKLAEGKGPTENLRSYLFQTAHHLMIDEVRIGRRLAPLEIVENYGGGSVERQCEEKMLWEEALHQVRSILSDKQQGVVMCRFNKGMSIKETAECLGMTANAVRTTQSRALYKLRMRLNGVI